ncbi:MAG: zf-HC2 domain-containing protein [Gemmatimonadota bacterium]|nr:zf-HC2 domain-containing protein [Gemmatimonadota bacterium]
MTEHWIDRLSEYVDGEMDPSGRAALETHLDECEVCSDTLEGLRRVVSEAAALKDRPPERDLWPEIAARLDKRGAEVAPLARARSGGRGTRFSLPQLAAAVLAALLIGAAGTWFAIDRGGTGAPIVAEGPTRPFQEASYAETVAGLEATLERRRDRLDPETVRAVEGNLEILDRAIAEIRAALEEDPDDPYLNRQFATTMMQKVDVLRRTTEAATRRGRTR